MSRTTEETEMPDIVFKGTDGNECEAFVAALQDFAFAKGLDEDHHWMLRFAKSRLRGEALRWYYVNLDPSVLNDWHLFVKALFNQWPSVTKPGDAEIATPVWSATTFSPAPSTVVLPPNPGADRNVTAQSLPSLLPRQYDASSTGQQIGLLRIVSEEGATIPQYVWWGYSTSSGSYHYLKITTNRQEALIVGFLPSSTPHTIGCLNSRSGLTTLSWHHSGLGLEYYRIVQSYPNSHTILAPAINAFGCVAKAWSILADGTLQASLSSFLRKSEYEAFEETKFTTTEVHVDTSWDNIRFVKPGAPLEQDKPKGNPFHPFFRARIVFEPL